MNPNDIKQGHPGSCLERRAEGFWTIGSHDRALVLNNKTNRVLSGATNYKVKLQMAQNKQIETTPIVGAHLHIRAEIVK